MTITRGVQILKASCCGQQYAFPRYVSANFSAFEYWTDGWREGSLMPNDEGLRHCQCGRFIRVADLIPIDISEDSNLPPMAYVKSNLLPHCIAQATDEKIEVAARRSYWHHLNHPYREIFRQHRDAEEDATKALWHVKHPDTRNWWDKFRGEKPPDYKRPPDSPFTYPAFQPSIEQIGNMDRLSEILLRWNQAAQGAHALALAELYREQGRFEEAQHHIRSEANDHNLVTARLIQRLITQKDSAPMRYRM